MAPISSGNYYIKNKSSKYYLESDGTDIAQSQVAISEVTASLVDNNVFAVQIVEGDEYTIQSFVSGSYVGMPASAGLNAALLWTSEPQNWRIDSAGSGMFSIREAGSNLEWNNNSQLGGVVLTNPKRDGTTSWIFTAA